MAAVHRQEILVKAELASESNWPSSNHHHLSTTHTEDDCSPTHNATIDTDTEVNISAGREDIRREIIPPQDYLVVQTTRASVDYPATDYSHDVGKRRDR